MDRILNLFRRKSAETPASTADLLALGGVTPTTVTELASADLERLEKACHTAVGETLEAEKPVRVTKAGLKIG